VSSEALASRAPSRTGERLLLVDLLKVVASQLIVLHHLAFYGPMSDQVAIWAPQLVDWLSRHGRLAVQVFLVMGGYLAARQLAPEGCLRLAGSPLKAVRDRYLRLVLPYAGTLLLAMLCAAWARQWMSHESIPDAASAWQVAAHLLLLQDLLGVPALSAGIWYVSIDLQLFVLFLSVLWVAALLQRRLDGGPSTSAWLVLGAVLAAVLHFNRDPSWDVAAPYFFGSYGLGVLAAWHGVPALRPHARLLAWCAFGGVLLALWLEFRSRLALAAVTACALAVAGTAGRSLQGRAVRVIEWLSSISYSLFLIHFGVCLAVNAVFTRFLPSSVMVQSLGVLVAWGGSVAAAALFHRWVERPVLVWLGRQSRVALHPAPTAGP
jgi:peptidoglycan/LPS O-acetylase OafA/YrhL